MRVLGKDEEESADVVGGQHMIWLQTQGLLVEG